VRSGSSRKALFSVMMHDEVAMARDASDMGGAVVGSPLKSVTKPFRLGCRFPRMPLTRSSESRVTEHS